MPVGLESLQLLIEWNGEADRRRSQQKVENFIAVVVNLIIDVKDRQKYDNYNDTE